MNIADYKRGMTNPVDNTIQIRRANDRFHSNLGWLNSHHTFSFGGHYDPAFVGFGALRVINDDIVAANQGFGEHSHASMEIISYVISGQLQHKDSMGNGRIIKPGEFQYMSAGSGVSHSEFNPSESDSAHFLQIWITPREKQTKPRYAELSINDKPAEKSIILVASPDGRDGSIAIHQDADLSFARLAAGDSATPESTAPNHWIHVISGKIEVHGEALSPGDGAAINGVLGTITATENAEFLIFSLYPIQL